MINNSTNQYNFVKNMGDLTSIKTEIKHSNYRIDEKTLELNRFKEIITNLELDKKELIMECIDLNDQLRQIKKFNSKQEKEMEKICTDINIEFSYEEGTCLTRIRKRLSEQEEEIITLRNAMNDETKDKMKFIVECNDLKDQLRKLKRLYFEQKEEIDSLKSISIQKDKESELKINKYKSKIGTINNQTKNDFNKTTENHAETKILLEFKTNLLNQNNRQLSESLTKINQIAFRNSCLEEQISSLKSVNKDLMEKNQILLVEKSASKHLPLITNIKLEKNDHFVASNSKYQSEKHENSTQTDDLILEINSNHEIDKLKTELEYKTAIIDQIMIQSNKYQLDLMQKIYENVLINAKNSKLEEKILSFEKILNETGSKLRNDRY